MAMNPGAINPGTMNSAGMNQGWTYHDRVASQDAGQTLLAFYCHRYRHSTPEEWRDRILMGQIQINGALACPDSLLQTGQRLSYHRPPWREPDAPLVFEILYEDEDVVAISKPLGLPVLPGGGFLENTLLHQLTLRFPEVAPTPLHRLGRGTSGVMLLAKSALAKSHLSRQWREASVGQGKLKKTYRALVAAWPLADAFVIDTAIGKVPHPRLGYAYGATPAGKSAYSEGQVLQRREASTLLEISIHTGRPHQIRIHLAASGYPLLGDPLYLPGGQPKIPISEGEPMPVPSDIGYSLHAHRIRFVHPRTWEPVEVMAPLPDRLKVAE